MKLSRENPYIRAAIDRFLLTNLRQEISFRDGDSFYSIVVSGQTVYLYNSMNELIDCKPVDQVT